MFNKKAFLILFLFAIIIGTVSAVSASNLANDTVADSDTDKIELSENEDISNTNTQPAHDRQNGNLPENEDISNTNTNEEIIGASDIEECDVLKDDVQWGTFTELQQIIDNAEEGVQITLYSNFYCDDDFDGAGITITKPITIDAQGHTWDACFKSSVLLIYGDGVVINNLNLIRGYDPSYAGAGAYVRSSSTTFNNCIFVNNTAGTNGGAIDVTGTLHLNGCIFYNNVAKGDGGAIYAHRPIYSNVSLDIYDCVFDFNWAKGNGGAIYLDCFYANESFVDGSARSFINQCLFISNEAGTSDALGSGEAGYGGAIFNFQYTDIEDTDFRENNATNGGGAIYMNNGVTTTDGTVTQTFGLNIHGTSNFINNSAGRYGGAIKIYANPSSLAEGIKGVLNIYDNVSFEGNEAKAGGALSIIDSNSNIEDAYFINNHAQTGGAVEGGKVINCFFVGNSEPVTSGTSVVCDVKPQFSIVQSGTYYPDIKLTITLKDSLTGKVMANQKVAVVLSNGKKATLTTNLKGVATYALPFTGTVIATFSYSGTGIKYSASQKVVIKKATPKITASKKTFKVKLKNKSFTVTLKVNNKVMKNTKLTLKVKGKTYSATTNSKGKATFKINKLTKKGNFKAVIKFAGNSYYNKASKTVKIKIK